MVPHVSDAEDIVQQTALTLWEKFDAYDPAQPFTPWACRFALNKVRQWTERKQRWQLLLARGLAEELSQRREELQPELDHRLAHLAGCVSKLPQEQQQLLDGYYYRRASVDELARKSNRSAEATYKTLQRIRHILRQCIDNASRQEEATA
jgi:RNA polymerase sigma-70 factor (ECF subfamily)